MSKELAYYHVTSTFVDKISGNTILPGALYEATEQRAQRLRAADVIGDQATEDEVAKFTGVKPEPEPVSKPEPIPEPEKNKGEGEAKPKGNKKENTEPAVATGGDKDAGDTKNS